MASSAVETKLMGANGFAIGSHNC